MSTHNLPEYVFDLLAVMPYKYTCNIMYVASLYARDEARKKPAELSSCVEQLLGALLNHSTVGESSHPIYIGKVSQWPVHPDLAVKIIYRMAGNFGGKIFWRIAENMSFGGIYFGG